MSVVSFVCRNLWILGIGSKISRDENANESKLCGKIFVPSPGIDICTSSCGFGVNSLRLTWVCRLALANKNRSEIIRFQYERLKDCSVGRENRLFGRPRMDSTNGFLTIIGRKHASFSDPRVNFHRNPARRTSHCLCRQETLVVLMRRWTLRSSLCWILSVCPEPNAERKRLTQVYEPMG